MRLPTWQPSISHCFFCKIDGMGITQWWSFFSMYAFLKLSAHLRD
ncbi:hypothetical protein AO382_0701 [Moraxella catarrhalis]|uniref:Uncharacterized protein n=1 Tax=Moraxella catarrhalis TaxID=480 RepID=A0A7Z1A4A4_MORCA|nr:hypothetical protein AO382_0701 [Moraxella catarrhalis]